MGGTEIADCRPLGGQSRPRNPSRSTALILEVRKMIFNFCLGPPIPRGVPGEGPDCHFPKELVGVGPIPARIRGF